MTEYSPGPWEVSTYHQDIVFTATDADGRSGDKICEVDRGYGCFAHEKPNDTSIANAHLIAAAPDLLEACRALLALSGNAYLIDLRVLLTHELRTKPDVDAAFKASAAIAKATQGLMR